MIEAGEFALMEPLEFGGEAGEFEVEFFLALAHAGEPLGAGFAERFGEVVALLFFLVLDFRTELENARGGGLFRGDGQRAGRGQRVAGAPRRGEGQCQCQQPQPQQHAFADEQRQLQRGERGAGPPGRPQVDASEQQGQGKEGHPAEKLAEGLAADGGDGDAQGLELVERGGVERFGIEAGGRGVRRGAAAVEPWLQIEPERTQRAQSGVAQLVAHGAVGD